MLCYNVLGWVMVQSGLLMSLGGRLLVAMFFIVLLAVATGWGISA
ncbi:hypothetical protein [Pantoea sp. C2G6]